MRFTTTCNNDLASCSPSGVFHNRAFSCGVRPARPRAVWENGAVKVTTTSMTAGYLRKNGVPYSESAVLTEYFDAVPRQPDGDRWLVVSSIVDDSRYLTEPFVTSTHFRHEPDARG